MKSNKKEDPTKRKYFLLTMLLNNWFPEEYQPLQVYKKLMKMVPPENRKKLQWLCGAKEVHRIVCLQRALWEFIKEWYKPEVEDLNCPFEHFELFFNNSKIALQDVYEFSNPEDKLTLKHAFKATTREEYIDIRNYIQEHSKVDFDPEEYGPDNDEGPEELE